MSASPSNLLTAQTLTLLPSPFYAALDFALSPNIYNNKQDARKGILLFF